MGQRVCRGLQIAQIASAALITSPANRAECDQWGLIYTTANWLVNIAIIPAIAKITRVLRLIRTKPYARGLSIDKFTLRAAAAGLAFDAARAPEEARAQRAAGNGNAEEDDGQKTDTVEHQACMAFGRKHDGFIHCDNLGVDALGRKQL